MTDWRRLLAILAAAAILPGAAADEPAPRSAHDLVRQGNGQFASGKYAEALASYQRAGELDARLLTPELLHDQAAAHFRLGQYDAALDLWTRVKESGDAAFEARTRYNLANCAYAQALAARGRDPQRALQHLADAAAGYRDALALDPQLADARANLELAGRLRRTIEEQLQQQAQQPKDQQQPEQQKSEQQPESQPESDQRRSENEKREPDAEQQEQQEDQKEEPASQPSEKERGEQSPETQPGSDEQREQNQPDRRDQDQSGGQQQSGKEGQTDGQETHGKNERQAGSPDPNAKPSEQAGADRSPRPAETSAEGENAGQPREVRMTQAEMERLLQRVRDAEKQRRELLLRRRVAQQKPVERDW